MIKDKDAVFAFTYKEEGGFSNDKHDPGGATNLGIIQTEYDAYRKLKGLPLSSVRHITKVEADEIYTKYYWDKIFGGELPAGIDLVVYDYSVNSGVTRAVKYVQRILKVKIDGKFGPITLAAIKDVEPKAFIIAFDDARLHFLQSLSIYQYFGVGWRNRVRRATVAALKMVGVKSDELQRGKMNPLFDIVLGLARHAFTGSGAGIAAFSGFDLHNPLTWLGIVQFAGGCVFSAVDKAQKAGHLDFQDVVFNTLNEINTKLDGNTTPKV